MLKALLKLSAADHEESSILSTHIQSEKLP